MSQWQARRKDKLTLQVKIHFLGSWERLVALAAVARATFGVGLRFQVVHSDWAFLVRRLRLARFVRHGRIG